MTCWLMAVSMRSQSPDPRNGWSAILGVLGAAEPNVDIMPTKTAPESEAYLCTRATCMSGAWVAMMRRLRSALRVSWFT